MFDVSGCDVFVFGISGFDVFNSSDVIVFICLTSCGDWLRVWLNELFGFCFGIHCCDCDVCCD